MILVTRYRSGSGYPQSGIRANRHRGKQHGHASAAEAGGVENAAAITAWAGTKLAVTALTEIGAWTSQRQAKSNILQAIDRVAEQLNNTRAVCRKYYVHPALLDAYTAGTLLETLQNGTRRAGTELDSDEAAVAALLRAHLGLDIAS